MSRSARHLTYPPQSLYMPTYNVGGGTQHRKSTVYYKLLSSSTGGGAQQTLAFPK